MSFGARAVDTKVLEGLIRAFGRHHLLERGIVDHIAGYDLLLKAVDADKPIYLFTGRGPSSPRLHLGHLVPFLFTRHLLKSGRFDRCLVQLSDDEKFGAGGLGFDEMGGWTAGNATDIEAVLDDGRVEVFANTERIKELYPAALEIARGLTPSKLKSVFGLTDADPVCKYFYPALQLVPAIYPELFGLPSTAQCVVVCGRDQLPHFELCRRACDGLGRGRPVVLAAGGWVLGRDGLKMSASVPGSAVFLGDGAETVAEKITKAVSAGRGTREQQAARGAGDLDGDVAYNYLHHFLEDGGKLGRVKEEYSDGRLLSSQVKALAIRTVTELLSKYNERMEGVKVV